MSLIQMSLSGTAIILAVVFLRALTLHRLPKRFFLALWCIAAARLLLPFSLPSMFSIYSLVQRITPAESSAQSRPFPNLTSDVPAGAPRVYESAATPAVIQSVDVWTLLWAIGAAVCVLLFGLVWIKCRRKFKESLPVSNCYAKDWLRLHPLRRSISLRQSDRISAPLTYGVFRPVILLPKSVDWADTETLNYVLAHELAHIKRFDALLKLVFLAALCIHWFNPLVWVMAAFANRDIELSCDEAVLGKLGADSRAGYAMALIRMEERKSGFAPLRWLSAVLQCLQPPQRRRTLPGMRMMLLIIWQLKML